MELGTLPADYPVTEVLNLYKRLNAGTQEQSLQVKMIPPMDSRPAHVGKTGFDSAQGLQVMGQMRLRRRLAVDGGSQAAHPHAYGTALDNDFCRSRVHCQTGWGKATIVRSIFVPRVCSSVDLVFSSPFSSLPCAGIATVLSCDCLQLQWTPMSLSALSAASFNWLILVPRW